MNLQWQKMRPGSGFTLIEVVSVVAVIFILAGLITIHLGNLRGSALAVSARALEREFAGGIERLAANGTELGPLQATAASGSLISQCEADPAFMGLQSASYRLSNPSDQQLLRVAEALGQLNALLSAGGLGTVNGRASSALLAAFNADLVVVRDAGNSVRGVYLKLSKP